MTFPFGFPHAFFEDATPGRPDLKWPPVSPGRAAGHRVITDNQVVSIHTRTGVQLFQYRPQDYSSLSWTRTLRDTSQCTLSAPYIADDIETLLKLPPWATWMSVFDGDDATLLWTGPIYKPSVSRSGMTVACRDASAYLSRTRVPITKKWEATDPAFIAEVLWQAMIEQKGLGQHPIVRADPIGHRFDYSVTADAQMLDQTMSDLVQLGLRWSIVNGVPILGPMPEKAIATFDERDFQGDAGIQLTIDGSQTYNDVLIRGATNFARASTPLHGEHLESLVRLDSISGVSNVSRAATEYLKHTARFTKSLEMPEGVTLTTDAPVSITELIPSMRFVVEAYGVLQLMELETVSVTRQAAGTAVSITLEAVVDTPELLDPTVQAQGAGGLPGATS